MRLFVQLSFLLPLALSWFSVSASNAHHVRKHHAKRVDSDLAVRASDNLDMYKRDFSNSRFTYYADGLGACGSTNQPGDFIVALNSQQYGGGENCYKMITITVNGMSAQAQIADECPGCPFGGLDFSEGLFQFFAPLSSGVLYGDWSFGSAPAPTPAPAPSPSTTWQPLPSPTPVSIWTPPLPTTIWTPPPPSTTWSDSSSSSSSLSSSSWSSSSTSSTSSPSSSSSPSNISSTSSADPVVVTAGPVPDGNSSILIDLNLAIVNLGGFLGSCQMTFQ